MELLRTIWRVVFTGITLPFALTIYFAATGFQFVGDLLWKLFDWLSGKKHRIAPSPPYKMPKRANDDL